VEFNPLNKEEEEEEVILQKVSLKDCTYPEVKHLYSCKKEGKKSLKEGRKKYL
jgi:hypothetical protein